MTGRLDGFFACTSCARRLVAADDVVHSMRVQSLPSTGGFERDMILVGGWFHADCPLPPTHEEIDRGPLAEVVERL